MRRRLIIDEKYLDHVHVLDAMDSTAGATEKQAALRSPVRGRFILPVLSRRAIGETMKQNT
jgi:hypothetical protein